MTREEWGALEPWSGLSFEDDDGTQYRGDFSGRRYLITVHVREDGSRYSTSEEVTVDDDG